MPLFADRIGTTEFTADLCVVGSGAGGATVAALAALAGLKVVVLEDGAALSPRDFTQREDEMLPLLFQDGGGLGTSDGGINVLIGRGLGGSTVHNTNICKPAAKEVLDGWNIAGFSARDLAPHYAWAEATLHVSRLQQTDLNRNNALLQTATQKLGWRGGFLAHNRRGCTKSGFCELGCSFDAKENAAKVLLPLALEHGATIIANCRAERVLLREQRAVGVIACRGDRYGEAIEPITVRAAVCMAGGAIGTPLLALRSQLPDPRRAVGQTLRLHPAAVVAGLFADPVESFSGIPQSFECTEKLKFDGSDDRSWIVPVFAHPVGFASLLPGFGSSHMSAMRQYPRLGALAAMLHDESAGQVRLKRGRAELDYRLNENDSRALLRGMHACAELLFAAGAQRVLVPFATPLNLTDPSQLPRILAHRYQPFDPLLTATHPMGTMALGRAVDETGRYYGIENLWVADASLFPQSLGGPPQLTVYAAAHRIAELMVAALGRR